MEKEINELRKKMEEHERRIGKIESQLSSPDSQPKGESTDINSVSKTFKELDLSNYDFVYSLTGIQLYIAVIHIARKELEIDGLSPTEISQICKEKIRLSKGVDRRTIGNALSKSGAKVDRIDNPRGKGFVYRIMRAGELYLQESLGSEM